MGLAWRVINALHVPRFQTSTRLRCGTLVLAGTLCVPASFAGEFRVGAQAGLPGWSFDVSVPLLAQSASVEPDAEPSLGIVGQYIMRSGTGTTATSSWGSRRRTARKASLAWTGFTLLGTAVDVVAETAWVTDVSWLAGLNLAETTVLGNVGDVTVFGSIGATYAKGKSA